MYINHCPKCESNNYKIAKSNHSIKCLDCGYAVDGPSPDQIVKLWNQSAEERIQYVVKALTIYGNAYVGEDAKNLWSRRDMGAYLSSKLDKHVVLRECSYISHGCVAEVKSNIN